MLNNMDNKTFAKKLREGAVILDYVVHVSTQVWEIILDRIAKSEIINGNTSDGYHTFNELYHHRAVLFSVVCARFPRLAWKSKRHFDGDMYEGMFIVGINTPAGPATYHYDIDPYWDLFQVKELENAPRWDGHTPADAIKRIASLTEYSAKWVWNPNGMDWALGAWECSVCKTKNDNLPCDTRISPLAFAGSNYCPNCGAKMGGVDCGQKEQS